MCIRQLLVPVPLLRCQHAVAGLIQGRAALQEDRQLSADLPSQQWTDSR